MKIAVIVEKSAVTVIVDDKVTVTVTVIEKMIVVVMTVLNVVFLILEYVVNQAVVWKPKQMSKR